MKIDHLIYASSKLEQGMDEIEALLGVRPVYGGQHPNFGTHNALLSLGPDCYLEVLAPDPTLPEPKQGKWGMGNHQQKSKLWTWVLRTNEIESLASELNQKGLHVGAIKSGRRQKPDGSIVEWKLTNPYAFLMQGAIPFLIDWGKSTHPAAVLPSGGKLIDFVIYHPNPIQVECKLELLNIDVQTLKSDEIKLMATIETDHGLVILS